MKAPVSSVIVCVYNRARQAIDCLSSIIGSDFRDFELVVVDDGSTDNSLVELEAFKSSHPDVRINIVRNSHNLGVSGARNAGILAAEGTFVFFVDSDCTVEASWLSFMLEGFTSPEIVAVVGTVIDAAPRTLAEEAYVGSARIAQTGGKGRSIVGGNMGFRREVLVQYRFDEALRYGSDEDELGWRLQSDGYQIVFTPKAIVHHNHPLTLSRYVNMGYRQGQGSARYWYKRGLYLGRDVLPLTVAILTIPMGFIYAHLFIIPLVFFLLHLSALLYSQVAFKGKTLGVALKVLPVEVLFYFAKAWAVYTTLGRIALGGEKAIRESKRLWWASKRGS